MSDLGGSNFASGALGAGVNQAVQKELSKLKNKPDVWQWASAVVGAAAAKAAGGDATSGASVAASGTKNNELSDIILHPITVAEGFVDGVKNGGIETAEAFADIIAHPIDTLNGLKELVADIYNDPTLVQKIGADALAGIQQRIDTITNGSAYETGEELGRLAVDVGLMFVDVGLATKLVEKVPTFSRATEALSDMRAAERAAQEAKIAEEVAAAEKAAQEAAQEAERLAQEAKAAEEAQRIAEAKAAEEAAEAQRIADAKAAEEAAEAQRIADAKVAEEAAETQKVADAKAAEASSKANLDYITTSGVKLEATPGKTTSVLGTFKADTKNILDELGNVKSTDFGPRDGGFNLLNTPDELYKTSEQFWNQYNKPWLDNVIERKDVIILATKPTADALYRINIDTGVKELSGFGKEYNYLLDHGYKFDSSTMQMVPKN